MTADRNFDVAIIGTGAGGGTLAARLAPTGLRILILERGERLLLLYAGMVAGMVNAEWLIAAVATVAVLANVTALQRILFAVRRKEA